MNAKKLSKYFKDNKYVIVSDLVDRETCKSLSDHLLELVNAEKTSKDSQCPLSESIYGDPIFDKLLEDLKPKIEAATGLKLNPTYSYARKYAPGDELKPHIDRAACEISATLTLGYDGKVWPIHVSRDDTVQKDVGAIDLDVGSIVIYRGMEINHWREPYKEGNWQCQVFLHYVDAEGPHKDLKYDNRPLLGASAETKNSMSDVTYIIFGCAPHEKFMYMTKENFLSNGAINTIIDYSRDRLTAARIGLDASNNSLDTSVRNASNCWLSVDRFDWLYQQLEIIIKETNWINFKFVLHGMELANYLEYHAGAESEVDEHGHGKYVKHIDGGFNSTRKLTFSIQLSDPSEYEGGDLLLWDAERPTFIPKNKGQIVLFPSSVMHEVTPVTRGIRKSLVGWVNGPQWA
jgi:hypothetical protein